MRTPDRYNDPPAHGDEQRRFDDGSDSRQAVEDRPVVKERPIDEGAYGNAAARAPSPVSADSMHAVHARQREEFGGFDLPAAFFGWLVAIGLGVLLTSIAVAAGAAFGLSDEIANPTAAASSTIGTGGAILLVLIGFVAYFAGGHVAGRMSRFDGVLQGAGVWAFGLVMTAILAAATAIFGTEYNILSRLNLPRIPIEEGTLATAGVITLIAVALATLIGALLGGRTGEAYHRRVDRVGTEPMDSRHAHLA